MIEELREIEIIDRDKDNIYRVPCEFLWFCLLIPIEWWWVGVERDVCIRWF